MNRLAHITCLLIALLFTLDSKAQITPDTVGCVPLLATFTPPAGTYTKLYWDFKDGASSDKDSVSHIFVKTGTYHVTLSDNGVIIATQKIRVLPAPEIRITTDTAKGCAPFAVQFTEQTVFPPGLNATGYLWDFGDGTGASIQHPSHMYISVDTFPVSLTITTNVEHCSFTKTFPDLIKIWDKMDVGLSIDSVGPHCQFPTQIYARNAGKHDPAYSFTWYLNQNRISQEIQPDPITVMRDDVYNITLEVTNPFGCYSRIVRNISVSYFPPVQIQFKDSACVGENLEFVAIGNLTNPKWDFGVHAVAGNTNTYNPKVIFKKNGIHEVFLQYESDQGCLVDTSISVFIKDKDAGFTFQPEFICSLPTQIYCVAKHHNYDSYTWNGIPGKSDFLLDIPAIARDSFFYNEPDSIGVKLEVTDDGCKSDTMLYYKFQLPNAQFDVSGHEGIIPWTVEIYDRTESIVPVVKWIVSWGDGTVVEYDSVSIKTASHTYLYEGEYYINMHIINALGCEDRYFGAWVHPHEPYVLNDGNSKCKCKCKKNGEEILFLCVNESFDLSVENLPWQVDALHFNMGPSIGNCDQQTSMVTTMSDNPGTYPLTVTLENGGKFEEIEGPIITVSGPKAVIGYTVPCDGSYLVSFANKSLDYTNVQWLIQGVEMTDDNFSFAFPGRGDYPVRLVAWNKNNGCSPDTAYTLIRLRDVKAKITAKDEWCFNELSELIATGSEDEVAGYKMGYVWSFPTADKPNIVTDQDTVSTLMPPGQQRIVLTVRDVNGCLSKDSVEVVSYFIQAGFTSDAVKICKPLKVLFQDSSLHDVPIASYHWSFQPQTSTPQISHTFTAVHDSSMLVSLLVTDEKGCRSLISRRFETYKPEARFSVPPIVCESARPLFQANDDARNAYQLTYRWVVDGKLVSELGRFNAPNFIPGHHKGRLEIREDSTQCTHAYDFSFYTTKRPRAVITPLEDSVHCYPKTIQFFGDKSLVDTLDLVSYRWGYSNGRYSFEQNPLETFGKGEFTIQLRVKSIYQCESIVETNIRLVGPEGDLMTDKSQICKGDSIRFSMVNAREVRDYYWDFGQGEVANNISPVSYTYGFYPPSCTTFASLVMYGEENNCRIIKSVPIQLYQVNAAFDPDTICSATIKLANKSVGANSSTWLWAGKKLESMASVVSLGVSAFGTYPVTLAIQSEAGLCKDTITQNVSFLEPVALTLPDNITACDGDTILLDVNPAYTYSVSPADVVMEGAGILQILTDQNAWVYIAATKENGCTLEDSIRIISRKGLNETTSRTVHVCDTRQPEALRLDSIAGALIEWSIPGQSVSDILSCSSCSHPSLQVPYSGPLTAVVTDQQDCSVITYQFQVIQANVDVPNVFSPNGDQVNDVFRPVALDTRYSDALVLEEMRIFNRWGDLIYLDDQPWDGISSGEEVTADVYFYAMKFKVGETCFVEKKGDVTLLR